MVIGLVLKMGFVGGKGMGPGEKGDGLKRREGVLSQKKKRSPLVKREKIAIT